MLNAKVICAAILQWPGLYETPEGRRFAGMPVSQVPSQLRDCGWRRVSHLDEHDFKKMGLEMVDARYVGGVRPKRFCRVVVARDADDPANPHVGHIGRCRAVASSLEDYAEQLAMS